MNDPSHAEDVPELVATKGRKGMVSLEVVAVVTKVVQEQQNALSEQEEIIAMLINRVKKLESK